MNKILCDFWYHAELKSNVTSLRDAAVDAVGERLQKILFRVAPLRAFLLLVLGAKYDYVIPEWNRYGRFYCLLQALVGGKKVVIVECIDFANLHKPTVRTKMLEVAAKWITGPAMRRSVAKIQMMTDWERFKFSKMYRVPIERLVYLPWPLQYSPVRSSSPTSGGNGGARYVFSSGRACCDWDSVFNAARKGDWPLVVVCSGRDLPHVRSLNRQGRATVLSDISKEDHDKLLFDATVTLLALEERMTSAGQIRLAESISAGVPVVATKIRGLEGYLIDGVTGVSVPSTDPEAISFAVSHLYGDDVARSSLITSARAHAAAFTRTRYFASIDAMLQELPPASLLRLTSRSHVP